MTIKELYLLYKKTSLVDTDTRSIRKNSIFFALKGDNFNGNRFAEEALKKGASYAIIDEKIYKTNSQIILVADTLKTLQELAKYHREQLEIPIISLTGSNGKTTSKELLNAVLSSKFRTTATHGNLNNHIGVPLTLLSMTPKTEIGIVEMGANHIHEIKALCDIAKPNFGYITNFGKAHLEGFGSIEGVIKGKTELYDYLRNNSGIAFINNHDFLQKKQSKGINTINFHSSLKYLGANPFVNLEFDNSIIQSQLIGKYNYDNIAAAISIGHFFKIESTNIKKVIENYIPKNNRSQIIEKNSNKIILDAYNANPSSMKVALENFNEIDSNSKLVILGDMFELGNLSAIEHQSITDLTDSMDIEKIFLIGSNFSKTITKKASKFEGFSDFIKTVNLKDFKNYTILIKGSRGMALEQLIDYI